MGNVTLDELRELCDFDAGRKALASPAGRGRFFHQEFFSLVNAEDTP